MVKKLDIESKENNAIVTRRAQAASAHVRRVSGSHIVSENHKSKCKYLTCLKREKDPWG